MAKAESRNLAPPPFHIHLYTHRAQRINVHNNVDEVAGSTVLHRRRRRTLSLLNCLYSRAYIHEKTRNRSSRAQHKAAAAVCSLTRTLSPLYKGHTTAAVM